MTNQYKPQVIFDPIYGFIKLTPVEWEIIHSPFYQRLRWIKQLGFSCYVFPGAEHSRFGHSIGVLHNAHCILSSCGLAVTEQELMDPRVTTTEAMFHKKLRIAALLHDLGTFCFSHTTEGAYINYAQTTKQRSGKGLPDDHENLGSFVIKNTDYETGITHILKKYGIDPKDISDLVKGVSPSVLANQILHSEVDCDRMDYLLRDAHYTGLKYGAYDRDYLLYHFRVKQVAGKRILTIKENALHCVEDFLISRYAWYSQVIRSPRGAKYDAIAERLCLYFLEKGLIHRYSDLLEMAAENPLKFYHFNDNYFMHVLHTNFISGELDKVPHIKSMAESILLHKQACSIRLPEFEQRLIAQDDQSTYEKHVRKAEQKVKEIQEIVRAKGKSHDWVIPDIPTKDVVFVKSPNNIVKDSTGPNVLLERDPVKILFENDQIKLLAEVENSVMSKLQQSKNFTPNLYCSAGAYELLKQEGVVAQDS